MPVAFALAGVVAEAAWPAFDVLPAAAFEGLARGASFAAAPAFTACRVAKGAWRARGETITTCDHAGLPSALRWTLVVRGGPNPQRVVSEREELDPHRARLFPAPGPRVCATVEAGGHVAHGGRSLTVARVGDATLLRCARGAGRAASVEWALGLRARPKRPAWVLALVGAMLAALAAAFARVRRDDPRALPWRVAALDAGGAHRLSCGTPVRHGVPGQPAEVLVVVAPRGDGSDGGYREGDAAAAARAETAPSLDALAGCVERRNARVVAALGALACALVAAAHALR
ncbi:MAG: hypothetical protein U0324_08480 [Polyangiales bacterium]